MEDTVGIDLINIDLMTEFARDMGTISVGIVNV